MQQENAQAQAPPTFRPGAPRQTAIPHDRAAFVHLLRLWFVQTGRNVDAIPKIGDKPIDLHQLYIEVETLGGPEKVQATGLWRLVAVKMGYSTHEQNDPQLAQIAKVLADTCVALLVPFDNFCLDRMRAIGTSIQNNRLGQMGLNPQTGMGGAPGVQAELRAGPGGMLPGDGANTVSMANFQRVLAFLQVTLKDWMPEAPPQTKLLRASQMDVAQMQSEGWSTDRITIVQRFRPALMQFRATFLRQQQMHQQALSQQGTQLNEANALQGAGGSAGALGSAQPPSLRSLQPGNPQHQGIGPQNPQTLALIHKLDSIPVQDLEARVDAWRGNMPNMEGRVQELLDAASRPGAAPEIGMAYARAKNDLDQNKFLFMKSQEILNRKYLQAQNQMAHGAYDQTVSQLGMQLSEINIVDGAGGAASASGSAQPPSRSSDQAPDASRTRPEGVFEFTYFVDDTLGDGDPLGGAAGVELEVNTPDQNADEDMLDTVPDDIGAGGEQGKNPRRE